MKFPKRFIWLALLGIAVLFLALILIVSDRNGRDAKPQREIVILSSIPLQWGENGLSDVVQGKTDPDPLVARITEHGNVSFVDNIAQLQAAKPDIAILIQPRAFSPDELVRLDNWVAAGGRIVVFADPALQWPSTLPVGDPQRPQFTSMLSPLFAHWGVELVLPMNGENENVEIRRGGYDLAFVSPGNWYIADQASRYGHCRVSTDRYLSECRPGKGQVLLVADADLLQSDLWQSVLPGGDRNDNMRWLGHLIDAAATGQRVVKMRGN